MDFITQDEAKILIRDLLATGKTDSEIRSYLSEHGLVDVVITRLFNIVRPAAQAKAVQPMVIIKSKSHNKVVITSGVAIMVMTVLVLASITLVKNNPVGLKVPTAILVPTGTSTVTGVSTGSVSGKVTGGYYAKPLSGVLVTLKGPTAQQTYTDNGGVFVIKDINTGEYQMSFSHPDYKISAVLMTVKAGENMIDKAVWGEVKNSKPLTVSGEIFADKNGNGVKDGSDTPLGGSVTISQKGNTYKYLSADANGQFSISIGQTGEYEIDPAAYTGYTPAGGQKFTVDGLGGTKTFGFGYKPTVSQAGFKIYVFNDMNENGVKEAVEENIHYQAVLITNLTGNSTRADGNSWKVGVPTDGYTESPVNFATYRVLLSPENQSWADYYKITKAETSVTVELGSSTQVVQLGAHKLF